jgi:hypothetical protein
MTIILIQGIVILFLMTKWWFPTNDLSQSLSALSTSSSSSSSASSKHTIPGDLAHDDVDSNLESLLSIPSPSSPYRLAYDQSYGFFDDLDEEDWKRRQVKAREHRHHDGNPLQFWKKYPNSSAMFYYYNYEPFFSCPHLHRVGGFGDGPKWTCDPYRIKKQVLRKRYELALLKQQQQKQHNQNEPIPEITMESLLNDTSYYCLVYSIGCAGKYVWEDDLYRILGPNICEFHIFDPGNYDRAAINAQRNMHYHPWGISSSYLSKSHSGVYKGPSSNEFYSLPQTLKLLGHENRTITLFKADCEFCEWFCYKDWITYGNVQQMFLEIHGFPRPETVQHVWPWPPTNQTPRELFDDLQNANYIMFSKEPNIHRAVMVCQN